jgi:hypothetical protein
MPLVYKVLGQAAPVGVLNLDLYTVPASTQTIISTLTITNTTNTSTTGRVFIRTAGNTAGIGNALIYDTAFAGNSLTTLTLGLTLAATDVITIQAGAANTLTFQAFGNEIS